jgi:hypothetical protein
MVKELAKKNFKYLIFLGLFIYGWIQYGDLAKIIADYLFCGKENYKQEGLNSILSYPTLNVFDPMGTISKYFVIFSAKRALSLAESIPETTKFSFNKMLEFVQEIYKRNNIPQPPSTKAEEIYSTYDEFVKKFTRTRLEAISPEYYSEETLESNRNFLSRFFGEITGTYTREMELKDQVMDKTMKMGLIRPEFFSKDGIASFENFQTFYKETNIEDEFVTKAFIKTNEINTDDINTWPSKMLQWTANFLGTITNSAYLPYPSSALSIQAAWIFPVFLFGIAAFDYRRKIGETSEKFSLDANKIFATTSTLNVIQGDKTFSILNSPLYTSFSQAGCFNTKEEDTNNNNNSFKKDSCFQIPKFKFVS